MSGRAKRRTVAPRKRRGPAVEQRSTIELEPGDVIYWDGSRCVVLERAQGLHDASESSRERRLLLAALTAGGNIGSQHGSIVVSSERRFVIADRVEL